RKHVENCLNAVFLQTYYRFQVYLVDNASTDGTADFVARNYPDVKVIASTVNLGFGGGHNLVIRETQAPYVLVLNQDAYLSPIFLQELVTVMKNFSDVGIAGGKLYSLRNQG